MALLAAFIVTIVIGDLLVLALSYIVEQFSKTGSMLVFLVLFAAMIPVAWRIAIRVTEPKPVATE